MSRLRQIIREEIKRLHKESNNKFGIVYHGTSTKYIQNILKVGLVPKPNKWYAKYETGTARAQHLKELPKELYATPNFNDAMSFARDTCFYGGNPIVLEFELLSSDKVEYEKQFSEEIVILNRVLPSRITIKYPADFNISKVRNNIDASKIKTVKITKINKILKPVNIIFRSGSKTTDRILVYINDDKTYSYSLLLGDLKRAIDTNKFDHITKSYEQEDVRKLISKIGKSKLRDISDII